MSWAVRKKDDRHMMFYTRCSDIVKVSFLCDNTTRSQRGNFGTIKYVNIMGMEKAFRMAIKNSRVIVNFHVKWKQIEPRF